MSSQKAFLEEHTDISQRANNSSVRQSPYRYIVYIYIPVSVDQIFLLNIRTSVNIFKLST